MTPSSPGKARSSSTISAPTLRPYQTAALKALTDAQAKGSNRLLWKLPTGTGKTVAFAELWKWPAFVGWMEQFRSEHGRQVGWLVIAHREELLFQAANKIRVANPDLIIDIEQGELRASPFADVVIASIQTLSARKFRRLKQLLLRHDFRLVIVDEAHHAAAATYRTALVHLGFLPPADASESNNIEAVDFKDVAVMAEALEEWDQQAPQDRLLLGCTATPNRTDAIGLGCVFQSIAYSYGLQEAIEDKWLVPITPWCIETGVNLDKVRISHGEFNQKDLAEAVNQSHRNKLAVAAWQEYAAGLPTLAFTVDVAHAHDVAAQFTAAGVRAQALSGETPKEDRRQMLRAYSERQIDVITNCMVLTEGVDLPLTGCILHLKPTKSATLYEQMTGRGLRIHPNKHECIVIDVVDIARRHSLQTAPVLYGLPPGMDAKGKELKKLAEQLEALKEKYPYFDIEERLQQGHFTLEQLEAHAVTFDVWTVPDIGVFGIGRAFDWVKVAEDRYQLQYPCGDDTETLIVEADLLGKWTVSCTMRPRGGRLVRQRTLAMEIVSAVAAAELAEIFIMQERPNVAGMKKKDAPWRGAPASTGQLGLMRRLRVPFRADVTKGEASNLIDIAFARKGRR